MRFSRRVENLIADFRGVPRSTSRALEREAMPINSLVEVLLERHEVGKIKPEEVLMAHWEAIFGSAHAARCRPERINRRGALIVQVANATLRRELMFDRRRILKEIRALPECGNITDIMFFSG